MFGGGSEPAAAELLPKLTSITLKGRARLGELLLLETRIDEAQSSNLDAVQSYILDLISAGEPIEVHRLDTTLRVRAHAFVGDITADGDGWHLKGRFKDSGRDDRFATAADLIWGGLILTGRPSQHIVRLYEIQKQR